MNTKHKSQIKSEILSTLKYQGLNVEERISKFSEIISSPLLRKFHELPKKESIKEGILAQEKKKAS